MNTAQSISRQAWAHGIPLMVAALLAALTVLADVAHAADLKVMATGLGEGTIVSDPPGIQCGTDCDKSYDDVEVTLKAIPGKRSKFSRWLGDACQTTPEARDTCKIRMDAFRSIRAEFDLDFKIPPLENFAADPPAAIQNFLDANRDIKTPALFLSALPPEYRQNWILMSRSESLQTGTAASPRLLLPSADGQYVFTIGLAAHASYPHSHPSAIEFMQWDAGTRNFRFHEIVLDVIPKKDTVPERPRGVTRDDPKCMLCHSSGSMAPGGPHKASGRPNWDTYDSWGGMMPFNRDRIYKGSVEAAAFRKILDPWTWRQDHPVRSIIEQLDLQPPDPALPVKDAITRKEGGSDDGLAVFSFDVPPDGPKLDPASTAYRFDGRPAPATEPRTDVERDADFIVLRHSTDMTSDEGRGVNLFDFLSGLNRLRIAGELIDHRHGPGNKDVRPIALAIASNCLIRDDDTILRANKAPLFPDEKDRKRFFNFFDARNGMTIGELVKDTKARAISLIRRKADIQKLNLHRKGDSYLISPSGTANGLIQQYDSSTGPDPSMEHIRKQVFRRPIDLGDPDRTEMLGPRDQSGKYVGIYVDREFYSCLAPNEKNCFPIYNTERIALYRYFLEPLGVSVDRWSMGVRGRSRTYTFADVFDPGYENDFKQELMADLKEHPVLGLGDPKNCDDLIAIAKNALSGLPDAADATPPAFAEVRRIFDKACVECHNGLRYPPYTSAGTNLSERPDDADPVAILDRVERKELPGNSKCPNGLMPCGGPALSKIDIETLRRWLGTTTQVVGSSRITTVAGIDYDFQGVGEFVLLRGRGLEIQSRHVGIESEAPLAPSANTGLSSCASVVNGVAIKVDGHRLTYQSRTGVPGPDGLELRIDGKLTKLDATQIVLESGQRIVRTGALGGLQIELPSGTAVSVVPGWLSSEKLWHFHLNVRQARATEGLMGAIRPGNWLPALPDGALLGPRPAKLDDRHAALYGTFAKAWRVSDATSLFDYESGTSPKTFQVDAWPGRSPKSCRLPPEAKKEPAARALRKALAKGVAEKHCSEVAGQALRSSCIQDVMATAEPGFAKTYQAGEQTQRKAFEVVPALVAPMHDETDVGAPVTFTWNAVSGSRGSPVSYLHCLWDADKKRFGFQDCAPVSATATAGTVSKTVDRLESGKSYLWKVIAEDGQGGSITSETRRLMAK